MEKGKAVTAKFHEQRRDKVSVDKHGLERCDCAKSQARVRELEAELAKEKGGWDAFYKFRKSVAEARYPGMTAEIKPKDSQSDAEVK